MPTVTRRLRHWKQRYAPNAAFIFRRRMLFGGKICHPGEQIPAELAANKAKLRRFWEGQIIELAEFEAPAPELPEPDEVAPELLEGGVYAVDIDGTSATVTEPETSAVESPKIETSAVEVLTPEAPEVEVTNPEPLESIGEVRPIRAQVTKSQTSGWYYVTTPDGKEYKAHGPETPWETADGNTCREGVRRGRSHETSLGHNLLDGNHRSARDG